MARLLLWMLQYFKQMGDFFMNTIKILLTVLLAVSVTAVTVYAQEVAPVAPAGDGNGAVGEYYAPKVEYYAPKGDYYSPKGDYYAPGGDAARGYYKSVPEPSTLALLGIGLAAGLGYRILKKKRG